MARLYNLVAWADTEKQIQDLKKTCREANDICLYFETTEGKAKVMSVAGLSHQEWARLKQQVDGEI